MDKWQNSGWCAHPQANASGKVNYDGTCVEFFKMLLTKKDLLKKIHNSEKYSSFASCFKIKDDNSFILRVVSTFTVYNRISL
jgi:hypothetical protein